MKIDTKKVAEQIQAQQQKLRLRTNYIQQLEANTQQQLETSQVRVLSQRFRQI